MELKTKINAEEGKQELIITREFDLPLELLFKAHADANLIEQWMSNPYATAKMLKFEGRKHGSYQQESVDANGKVVFKANGTFHEFIPNQKITRTFEMENAPMGVQLEFLRFEKLTDKTSKLTTHVVYESLAIRDQVLKTPFAMGISMAHDRMLEIMIKLK
jgi:uncharacterized protein YndB with AHSA1/START domain